MIVARGQLRQDQDSHWYFIPVTPVGLVKRFDRLNDRDDDDAYDAINDEYDQYRIDEPFSAIWTLECWKEDE